ncbi:zinc finger BED domain-containing protein RICESLEEPER 2-like [Gossypium australe]|uniref:Zinc finger BED domain-containing protein RICESLEEPER 2-like n=1 Tax=Gossypium australe TaxID=47621 RepID=A0A5B6VKX3_9ROSI|nr:zinc finger BED domain-containing protein RICESLEEPER 2-like [Gossypium australe]
MDRISITTDLWKLGQKIQYMKCLQDWGIKGKVCSISMDNASYNDATVRMLKDSLSFHKKLLLNGKFFHVRCCANILNLLVHDGLFEIEDIIDNVRESMKYITSSIVRLTMFNDIVKQLQLPNKRLILDFCTRWNATYAMVSCVLEFKDVFPQYAQRDASYKYLPIDEDWVRVEEVCSFLAVFNEVTNTISENCDDFDALEWWKVNNIKFRILSKMTCEILSIPITTVASESALVLVELIRCKCYFVVLTNIRTFMG